MAKNVKPKQAVATPQADKALVELNSRINPMTPDMGPGRVPDYNPQEGQVYNQNTVTNPTPEYGSMPQGPATYDGSGMPKTKNTETNLFVEQGLTGLTRFGGFVYEEWLTELQGKRGALTYREMRDNDAVIGAIIYTIEMLLRTVKWRIAPAGNTPQDIEASQFLDSCLHDMSITWHDTISEILTFLHFGWAYMELCYKKRMGPDQENGILRSKYNDGRIGWKKFSIRAQETLWRWRFDYDGTIKGMEQISPPDYKLRYIPIEKALLFRTKSNKNNPEGRSILRNAYRCLSDDTEILTKNGFILVKDLRQDDTIYTLNPSTDSIELQPVLEMHSYDHRGKMVHAHSRFIDQLVTPNHRMWVRRAHKDTSEFIEASECNKTVSFKAHGNLGPQGESTITIGNEILSTRLWSEFLGFFLSEGHTWHGTNPDTKYRYEIGITQKKQAQVDLIRTILANLPWRFNESKSEDGCINWTCTKRELYEHLAPYGKQLVRYIPEYVFTWSKENITAFLKAYALGDGSVGGGTSYKDSTYTGTTVIYTASRQMVDDLAHAVFLAGYRPNVRWQIIPDSYSIIPGIWVVSFGKPMDQLNATWNTIDYDGKVYCPTTENGIIYIRRNGKCSWTGNSWYFKKNIEEIEAIGIERDLAGFPIVWLPPEIFDQKNPEAVASYNKWKKIITNIKRDEQEGLMMPLLYDEKGNKQYDISMLSASTGASRRQFDTNIIIQRYENRIAMVCLADFLMLGHEKGGSYALGKDKTSMFQTALTSVLQNMADTINTYAIPRLFKLNTFKNLTDYPKIVHNEIEKVDIVALSTYVKDLTGVGALDIMEDKELENYLRQVAALPLRDDYLDTPTIPIANSDTILKEDTLEREEFMKAVRKLRKEIDENG